MNNDDIPVLLVQLPLFSDPSEKNYILSILQPSLGLGYLAAVLNEKEINTNQIDLNISLRSDLESWIINHRPRIIGITCFASNSHHLSKICGLIRRIHPNGIIVVGGVHATYTYKQLLSKEMVDYVVRFEGEKSFLMLCQMILSDGNAFRSIPNLSYLDGCELVCNPVTESVSNLDSIPPPVLDLVSYPSKMVPLMTSRGCSFRCIYCSSSAYWGKSLRFRSMDNIKQELGIRISQGFRHFSLQDDNLNINEPHLLSLCKLFEAEKIVWGGNFSVPFFKEEHVTILKQSGCISLNLGIESADEDIQRSIGKVIDLEKTIKIVKKLVEQKISVSCGFILFHHCDTESSINKTIAFAKTLRECGAVTRFFVNTPFPGTEQYSKQKELGLTLYPDSKVSLDFHQSIMDTKHFKRSEMNAWVEQLNMENIDVDKLKEFFAKEGKYSLNDLNEKDINKIRDQVFNL